VKNKTLFESLPKSLIYLFKKAKAEAGAKAEAEAKAEAGAKAEAEAKAEDEYLRALCVLRAKNICIDQNRVET
jgi:membrane protein involved in colicin uptake